MAASLLVMAAVLGLYALNQHDTATFLRSLVMPGSNQFPDVEPFRDAATGAGIGALVLALVALLVLRFPSGLVPMLAAFLAVLMGGSGIWFAIGAAARQTAVEVGPLTVPGSWAGVVLALASATCLAGSMALWRMTPPESHPYVPHMPPPTHQGG